MKPGYHIGQQVVVNIGSSVMIGTIEAGQIVSGIWKYGIRIPGFTHNTPTFVYGKDIKYVLKDGEWIEPKGWGTVATF